MKLRKYIASLLSVLLLSFVLPVICSAEVKNIIENGTFEAVNAQNMPSGWTLKDGEWGVDAEFDTVSNSGLRAVRFYGKGESVYMTQEIRGIIGGTEYSFSGYVKVVSAEKTGAMVKLEWRSYDKDGNYLGRFIHYGGISGTTWKWSLGGNSVYESGDTVKGKKLSETATSYVIVTLCYVNISDLKIWYDAVEAPAAETWEGYTPYTYMTDFEADNVGTTPTSEFITFNGSVTEDKELYGVESAAGDSNSNIITLNKIPQKNFIMSMDMRLSREDRGEDLQLWMFGTPGALIARHQNVYFNDLNKHSYVIVGDMINKKINVYIDGVLTSHIEREQDVENWKTTMENNSITTMNFQFVNVYIDNLKVDIDTEMLYAGGYIADANGNKVQSITSGQTVKGAIYGASYLRNDNPAQIIMAVYEVKEDGTLYFIKHNVTDINGNRGGKIIYSDDFNVGTLEAGKTYCVKQFVWDNVDDMNPLTLVTEVFTAVTE